MLGDLPMIDEHSLEHLTLAPIPRVQIAVGHVLRLNYGFGVLVKIKLEGVENIPLDRPVMFALNHTDRYNYWPFQYQMWRRGGLPFTVTWVKAKYFQHPLLGPLFKSTNNIPIPSKGYLILQDAQAVLGRELAREEYRWLRDQVNAGEARTKVPAGLSPELAALLETPRRDFDPPRESYATFMTRWNDRLMGLVEARTLEALLEKRHNVIVFPQGTRAIRLLPARLGMLQFALRHRVTIVPVGSNGCEALYPGSNPVARPGTVTYRIGRPLSVDDAFADCTVDEPFRPFTAEAEPHRERFTRAADLVTEAIDALLDEPYKRAPEEEGGEVPLDRLM